MCPKRKSSEEHKKFSTGPQWNSNYKSKLCQHFQEKGQCPYTTKCQFAHGETELLRWARNEKTKLPVFDLITYDTPVQPVCTSLFDTHDLLEEFLRHTEFARRNSSTHRIC